MGITRTMPRFIYSAATALFLAGCATACKNGNGRQVARPAATPTPAALATAAPATAKPVQTPVIAAAQPTEVATVEAAEPKSVKLEAVKVEVTRTGRKGDDGTPHVKMAVTFNNPIPDEAAMGRFEICTNRCYPQSDAKFTQGSTRADLQAYLHHSLYKNSGEFAKLTFFDASQNEITVVTFNPILPRE